MTISIEIDGKIKTHIQTPIGESDTICGVFGDDPGLGHFIVTVGAGTVDCETCSAIWRACREVEPSRVCS